MHEPWTPPLRLTEHPGGCRLTLDGLTSGDGASLQEAADELIARLRRLALAVHRGGLQPSPDAGPPDLRLLDFLWELGERAVRGEDIRRRVLDARR